jgi:hypothetical protein
MVVVIEFTLQGRALIMGISPRDDYGRGAE